MLVVPVFCVAMAQELLCLQYYNLGRDIMNKSFLKAGHTPTLLSAFLYFDLAFMV